MGTGLRDRIIGFGPITARLTVMMAAAALWATAAAPSAEASAVSGAQQLDPPSGTVSVVMTEIEPFVVNDDGRADGFYAEIWDVVADELGVTYEVTWVDSFGELLEEIEAGRADIAVAPLSPTAEREVSFDFSSAVISSGPQLGYHERTEASRGIAGVLFSGAVRRILLAAVAGLVVLAHLIWLVERNRTDEEGGDFDPSYARGIWDGFWWATVTVTTVGYGDKAPRSIGGRVIALFAMLLSLFLVGAFVSQVTNILQETRQEAAVSSVEDIGDRPVGVVAGSTFAAYMEDREVTVVGYAGQAELFDAVADGEVDLLVANPYALTSVGPGHGVVPVGSVLYEEFETFGLSQGSPWREPINQVLADLQASGEVEEIVNRWIK